MHCAQVEQYLEKNEIEVESKEIYQNPANASEFNEVCDAAGIALSKRGVPLLYTEDGCIMGSDAIIDHFENLQNPKEEQAIDKPFEESESQKKLTIPALI